MRFSYASVKVGPHSREFPFSVPLPTGMTTEDYPRVEGVSVGFEVSTRLSAYHLIYTLGSVCIGDRVILPMITIPDYSLRPAEYRCLEFLDPMRRQIYYEPEKWKWSIQFLDTPTMKWRVCGEEAEVIVRVHLDFGKRLDVAEGAAKTRHPFWQERFKKKGRHGPVQKA